MEILWTFTHMFPVVAVDWGITGIVSADSRGYVYIWSDTGPSLKLKFKADMSKISDVKISHSGKYIAVAGDRVIIYTFSGHEIYRFKNTSFTNRIVWFPDDKRLLAIQNKGVALITIFQDSAIESNTETGCPLLSGDISPDGEFFATVSCDGRVDIWSLTIMKPYRILDRFQSEIRDIVWTKNGKLFVVSDEGLKIYDTKTWKTLGEIRENTFGSLFLSVSPLETGVIYGGTNKKVYYYDFKTNIGYESEPFFHWVMDGAWSENGLMFVSVSADNTGRVYMVKRH